MILLTLAFLLLVPGSTLVVVGSEADEPPKNKPLVVRVTQDRNTSLYTIPIKNGAPLVVDLAGPLVWSTCPASFTHSTVPCQWDTCRTANMPLHRPRRCSGYVDPGVFWASREEPSRRGGCACAAHPFNSVTGECSTGDLTTFAMSANATNGTAPLAQRPESFTAVGSCAPDHLVSRSLPTGTAGVAGFSRSPLSLPSQLSAQRKFGNTFALCMPGFALFGNTSIHLRRDLISEIPYYLPVRTCELIRHPRNGGYYLPVKKIRVGWDEAIQQAEVSLPTGALDLDVGMGRGGVVLSTVTRYMAMRSDVYNAFIKVYDTVMRGYGYGVKRVPAVWPFELCYDLASLPPLGRNGMDVVVPVILLDLDLAGAADSRPWYLHTESYLVFVQGSSARSGVGCAGVVEMGHAAAGAVEDQPAVVLGTKQLQDRLLVFDLDKGVLGFSDVIREAIPVAVCEDSFRDVAI